MCSEDWTRSQQGAETPCHKAASQEVKQRPGHVQAPAQGMRIWKDSLSPKGPMLAVHHTYTRVERAFLAPQSTKGKLLDANQQNSWQPQASLSNWGRGPEQRGVKQQSTRLHSCLSKHWWSKRQTAGLLGALFVPSATDDKRWVSMTLSLIPITIFAF